ncbi:unnamed protein product [Amaranthus hypochondriacus]
MHYKAITSISPHLQTKIPITQPNSYSSLPPLNFNHSVSSLLFPPKSFNKPLITISCNSKPYPSSQILQKLTCISPTHEFLVETDETHETHEPEFDINGVGINPENEKLQSLGPTKNKVKKMENQTMLNQIIEMIKFCGPATGIWVFGPLMSLIDTVVVGQSSSIELAALGPGTVLCDYVGYVFMFLSVATSNMVASSLAQKDEKQVQHQISMLLFLGLACGVLMLLLTKGFGERAVTAFVGVKNVHIVPAANSYIQIRALAWPAILIGSIAQSASLAMKDSLGPVKALLIAIVLKGIGDVVLCTFLGNGIAGAAWATAIAQIVAAYMMIDVLNTKGYNGFSFSVPSFPELREIFKIAAPVFLTMVSKIAFYGLIIYVATSMGTHVVAAHQVLLNIYSICSVWGEPLSQTAQSFMPELLYGANRNLVKARSLLKSLLVIGLSSGLLLGTIAAVIPMFVPNLFTSDPVVIEEMRRVCLYLFVAVSVTPCILPCEGTLLASKDFKFISMSMSACFAFGALVLLLVKNRGLGLAGCWSALVVFQATRFMLSLRRILSRANVLYSKDLNHFRLAEQKAS